MLTADQIHFRPFADTDAESFAQAVQRRGAASTAIQALSSYAFTELKQGRVEIVVADGNAASLAAAATSGAARECLACN